MERKQLGNRLGLDEDEILHKQIHSIAVFDSEFAIHDRGRHLLLDVKTSALQLIAQAKTVCALNKPAPRAVWTFIAALTIWPVMSLISISQRA